MEAKGRWEEQRSGLQWGILPILLFFSVTRQGKGKVEARTAVEPSLYVPGAADVSSWNRG